MPRFPSVADGLYVRMARPVSQFWLLITWPASHTCEPIEPSGLTWYARSWPDQSPLLKRAWYKSVFVPHEPVFSDTADAAAVLDWMSTAMAWNAACSDALSDARNAALVPPSDANLFRTAIELALETVSPM